MGRPGLLQHRTSPRVFRSMCNDTRGLVGSRQRADKAHVGSLPSSPLGPVLPFSDGKRLTYRPRSPAACVCVGWAPPSASCCPFPRLSALDLLPVPHAVSDLNLGLSIRTESTHTWICTQTILRSTLKGQCPASDCTQSY